MNSRGGSGSKEEVYCICQTSDSSRFMICCDHCEVWYHGDCISVTEQYSKRIKRFYCLICRDRNPNLEIVLKDTIKKDTLKREQPKKIKKDKIQKDEEQEHSPLLIERKIKHVDFDSDSDFEYIPTKRSKIHNFSDDDEDEIKTDEQIKINKSTKLKTKTEKPKSQNRNEEVRIKAKKPQLNRKPKEFAKPAKARREKRERSRKEEKEEEITLRQCLGPGCINSNLKGSKYCSDQCGMQLARSRILEILPSRIERWRSIPSKSDEISQRLLEKVRKEQMEAKKELDELDERQAKLEEIIERSKSVRAMSEEECNALESDLDGELSIYCVTCGHEVSYKNALRHMERCFNKFESQTSYGSVFKTKTEGVFCDYYNAAQKTYCKRLKVLCPEHSKDSRFAEDEVCGAPLTDNCFELSGEFCNFLKKKCSKHYSWEKLRRAELDMERVNLWLKLDDLFEQEQKIRFTMANRGGVVGLLLHQTTAYETTTS